jgi:hypothetical protein
VTVTVSATFGLNLTTASESIFDNIDFAFSKVEQVWLLDTLDENVRRDVKHLHLVWYLDFSSPGKWKHTALSQIEPSASE